MFLQSDTHDHDAAARGAVSRPGNGKGWEWPGTEHG